MESILYIFSLIRNPSAELMTDNQSPVGLYRRGEGSFYSSISFSFLSNVCKATHHTFKVVGPNEIISRFYHMYKSGRSNLRHNQHRGMFLHSPFLKHTTIRYMKIVNVMFVTMMTVMVSCQIYETFYFKPKLLKMEQSKDKFTYSDYRRGDVLYFTITNDKGAMNTMVYSLDSADMAA